MKRFAYIIMSAFVLSLAVMSSAWAAETKEEKTLQKEVTAINKTAGSTQGENVVTARLEKEFGVTDTQIQALRDKKLGYGEIAIMFSLAQKLPGGITDANITEVMTLRQGSPAMGWGEVAKKLDVKLGPTVSQVKSVNKFTEREMKQEVREQMERHQERHEQMMEHEGLGGGQGMSHGKDR